MTPIGSDAIQRCAGWPADGPCGPRPPRRARWGFETLAMTVPYSAQLGLALGKTAQNCDQPYGNGLGISSFFRRFLGVQVPSSHSRSRDLFRIFAGTRDRSLKSDLLTDGRGSQYGGTGSSGARRAARHCRAECHGLSATSQSRPNPVMVRHYCPHFTGALACLEACAREARENEQHQEAPAEIASSAAGPPPRSRTATLARYIVVVVAAQNHAYA